MDTVIFDMDGLLIDSEPMWQAAEKEVFSSVGVNVSAELSSHTATLTTSEVTAFWFQHSPWNDHELVHVENAVIDKVADLIQKHGEGMHGVEHILKLCRQQNCKIGLATNSPFRLIAVVLEKLGIQPYFDAVVSSEQVSQGKPHPDVYLKTLQQLNASPATAIAFEDSATGIQAAHSAGMKTVAIPSPSSRSETVQKADLLLDSLAKFNQRHFEFLCSLKR